MERKIGEIFEHNGEWYQCIESPFCGECSLFTTECGSGTKSNLADKVFGQCSKVRRFDKKQAIFKKLEKVGKPYISSRNKKRYQLYRCFCLPIITKDRRIEIGDANWVGIEIKQNKEDMEEKKVILGELTYKYINGKITYEAFEKRVIELLNNKEESKPKLKEFDLEAAKAGKPVCTRDGRKARIICFDAKGNKPIIALIEDIVDKETTTRYLLSGRLWNDNVSTDNDLMMLPEKKEGFMNVYKKSIYNTKEEAFNRRDKENYLMTIKADYEE